MEQYNKYAMLGASAGCSLGAITWLIVLGFQIGSVFIIMTSLLWGGICVWGMVRLYDAHPERMLAIIGLGIVWLILLNIVFVNIYYDQIPDMAGGVSTGKDLFSLARLNTLFCIVGAIGVGLMVIDIIRGKWAK